MTNKNTSMIFKDGWNGVSDGIGKMPEQELKVCKRCGDNEFRNHGFCSEYCRDMFDEEQEIIRLQAELDEMTAYADKLADGLPMLPKDIEVMRTANANLADEIIALQKQIKQEIEYRESWERTAEQVECDLDNLRAFINAAAREIAGKIPAFTVPPGLSDYPGSIPRGLAIALEILRSHGLIPEKEE